MIQFPGCIRCPDWREKPNRPLAGPRAAQYLVLGAKARTILHGRYGVACEDIRAMAIPVMRHRMFTNFNADAEGIDTVRIVQEILATVEEPDEADYA